MTKLNGPSDNLCRRFGKLLRQFDNARKQMSDPKRRGHRRCCWLLVKVQNRPVSLNRVIDSTSVAASCSFTQRARVSDFLRLHLTWDSNIDFQRYIFLCLLFPEGRNLMMLLL